MITGYTFDRAKVTAVQDSVLYDFLNFKNNTVIPNIGNGMAVTVNGLTCTIATGKAVICGRLIEISSAQDVQIPANSTGYLCLTVDLSQTNTSSGTPGQTGYTCVINQVRAEFVTSLTQNDLFNGGLIYNFPLGTVTSTTTAANFAQISASYAGKNPLNIANGGTGATNASAARINLGVLDPYILYDNSGGTQSNITMSDSAANYDYLEVYFRNNDYAYCMSSIYDPNGKAACINTMNVEPPYVYFKSAYVQISGNSVSWLTNRNGNAYAKDGGTMSLSSDNQIYITKIVGYKN